MIGQALPVALALARRFEGLFLSPYLCPAGVPTIGYGSTYYEDGAAVQLTDAPITRERAEDLLRLQVERVYLPQVISLCPQINSPERLAAIIDWTYNLGAGNLKASSMRRAINRGDWDDARVELQKWTRGGGRVLPGLVSRRAAEAALL